MLGYVKEVLFSRPDIIGLQCRTVVAKGEEYGLNNTYNAKQA